MAIVVVLASLPYYVLLLALALDLVEVNNFDARAPYLILGQTLIFVFGLLAARVVLPPIDLAELTPGRRMLRLVGRSGVVTVLAGLALAFLKAQAGWG